MFITSVTSMWRAALELRLEQARCPHNAQVLKTDPRRMVCVRCGKVTHSTCAQPPRVL